MTSRPDFEPLVKDLGCAPNPAQRMVAIPRDIYEEFQSLAKRTYCSTDVAIVSALSQWLGRV